jgi:hypothetical protein
MLKMQQYPVKKQKKACPKTLLLGDPDETNIRSEQTIKTPE